jgi:hypothetical protein
MLEAGKLPNRGVFPKALRATGTAWISPGFARQTPWLHCCSVAPAQSNKVSEPVALRGCTTVTGGRKQHQNEKDQENSRMDNSPEYGPKNKDP